MLEHAITYLVQEQARGSQDSSRYAAIVLLCSALGEIAERDRRRRRTLIRQLLRSLAPLPRR